MENLNTPNPQDEAERFVLGKMEGRELDDFLARQLLDPTLRAEVAAARERIKAIRGLEPAAAKPGRLGGRWVWLLAVLVILGLGIGVFQHLKEMPSDQPQPTQEPIAQQPPAPAPQQQQPDTSPAPPPRALAASLKPNPALEYQLGPGRFRDDGSFQWIQQPFLMQKFALEAGKIRFFMHGACTAGEPISWQIYSNTPADYDAGKALFQGTIQPELQKDGRFRFQIQQKLALAPGLYYYFLENPDDGELYFVGKMVVGN